ncbi:hypothetical protein JCM33374_g5322 [Metschnikowia sp. JCM 33374]|nr:hypothetical protein JCM33374_g5322 [Metschnikowia sp. JCM 33374]
MILAVPRTTRLYLSRRYHVYSKVALTFAYRQPSVNNVEEDTREDMHEGPKTSSKHETLRKLAFGCLVASSSQYWGRSPLKSIVKGYAEFTQTFLEYPSFERTLPTHFA